MLLVSLSRVVLILTIQLITSKSNIALAPLCQELVLPAQLLETPKSKISYRSDQNLQVRYVITSQICLVLRKSSKTTSLQKAQQLLIPLTIFQLSIVVILYSTSYLTSIELTMFLTFSVVLYAPQRVQRLVLRAPLTVLIRILIKSLIKARIVRIRQRRIIIKQVFISSDNISII